MQILAVFAGLGFFLLMALGVGLGVMARMFGG